MPLDTPRLTVSVSPHIRSGESVPSIMLWVLIALIPATISAVYVFGLQAILLILVSIASCLGTEFIISRFLLKKATTLGDLSAVITGLLLAFNLPPALPLEMAALGGIFAIGIVKMAFGGLGQNIVNPALAGRIFLMACFPAAMTAFSAPLHGTINGFPQLIDGIAQATPLTALKTSANAEPLIFADALGNMFWGFTGGCIGETSSIALCIGAAILWYKRIIGFGIPIAYLGTVFLCAFFFNGIAGQLTSEALIVAVYHVMGGGLLLGAFFMATDMVTSPVTPGGRIVFGIGCGVLTFLIRTFGGYPEGVSYAIVLMNLTTPLCDRFAKPRLFGKKKLG